MRKASLAAKIGAGLGVLVIAGSLVGGILLASHRGETSLPNDTADDPAAVQPGPRNPATSPTGSPSGSHSAEASAGASPSGLPGDAAPVTGGGSQPQTGVQPAPAQQPTPAQEPAPAPVPQPSPTCSPDGHTLRLAAAPGPGHDGDPCHDDHSGKG